MKYFEVIITGSSVTLSESGNNTNSHFWNIKFDGVYKSEKTTHDTRDIDMDLETFQITFMKQKKWVL
jgi:hypothetical protein